MATSSEFYLQLVIAGETLTTWLQDVTPEPYARSVLCWALIHTCYGYYHAFGPFCVTAEDFDLLSVIIDRIELSPNVENLPAPLSEAIGYNFICYLYHWVVGAYGHLSPNQSYADDIRNIVTALAEEEQMDVSLILVPRPTHTLFPFPTVFNG